MVTNYPRQFVSTRETTHGATADESMVARAMNRLAQVLCGVSGHDSMLHFEGKRVMMRCTSCGFDTPGWEISDRGPRLRYEGDARRHSMANERQALRKTA
jgi:hypothetical protein